MCTESFLFFYFLTCLFGVSSSSSTVLSVCYYLSRRAAYAPRILPRLFRSLFLSTTRTLSFTTSTCLPKLSFFTSRALCSPHYSLTVNISVRRACDVSDAMQSSGSRSVRSVQIPFLFCVCVFLTLPTSLPPSPSDALVQLPHSAYSLSCLYIYIFVLLFVSFVCCRLYSLS